MNRHQLVGEIMALSSIINENTEHSVFVRFSGHVNEIDVDIHLGGWKRGSDSNIRESVYTNNNRGAYGSDDKSLKLLTQLKQKLLKIVLENKIDTSKLPYEIQTIEIKKYRLLGEAM